MTRLSLPFLVALPLFAIAVQECSAEPGVGEERKCDVILREFEGYSGAKLVFHRRDLPDGRYHDVLRPLSEEQKAIAAAICLEEAKLYPPRYFAECGLEAIGVFAACASKTTSDRTRRFDRQLGGYRYFGVYNGKNAVAAAFYSEGQLALTFHHEIFHHIDSTVAGVTAAWHLSSDDAFYQAAISGRKPYSAAPVVGDDLAALRNQRIGYTLKDAVSDYAATNFREDQAETARHLMSMLPNSLVQAIDQPELAGSQRILHVLREYEAAVPDGPGFDWFVDVALHRASRDITSESVVQLLGRLERYAKGGRSGFAGLADDPKGARMALKAVVRVKPEDATAEQANEMVRLSTSITIALLRQRVRPDRTKTQFDIWGREDADGVNRTLRRDVAQFGIDAKRLSLIGTIHHRDPGVSLEPLTRAQLTNLHLIARYYRFIKSHWSITPGTEAVFVSTQQTILRSLPAQSFVLAQKLQSTDLLEIARQAPADRLPPQ